MFLFSALDPNNKREFDFLATDTAEKFVTIVDGVYASLSEDGARTNEMVLYVRKELNIVPAHIRQTIPDVILVRDLSQFYFKYHPMDPKYHHESDVYILGWNPSEGVSDF